MSEFKTNPIAHIFIVDDNPENLQVLGTALTNEHYKITIIANASVAVKMAQAYCPDLILLDVMMPDVNGFEICKALKSNPQTQQIEIIFVTAAIDQESELKGLALGAVDYIHKPFSIPVIQARTALHIERIRYRKLRDDIERMTQHDLKNPLNAILGFPQLLLDDNTLTAMQRDCVEEILRAGKEMQRMINNSLNLIKMEKGSYQLTPETVDVFGVIENVVKDLQTLSESNKIKIKIEAEKQQVNHNKPVFFVRGEKNLCYSLFANLIHNAIEASPVGSEIVIKLYYENNQGIISITNLGSVPESIRPTFFHKYSTAGKKQGTGLGTYSAKLMVETQKGTISMATTDEETCVTVCLPCQEVLR